MEESFFPLMAATGGSAMAITSVAFTTSTWSFGYSYFASSAST